MKIKILIVGHAVAVDELHDEYFDINTPRLIQFNYSSADFAA